MRPGLALVVVIFAVLASSARAVPASAAPEGDAPQAEAAREQSAWSAEFDKLWSQREDAKAVKRLYELVEGQLKKDEADFEANWRLAALLNWQANTYPNGDLKAGMGKRAWTIGDRAIQARPGDVRGQYHAAIGIGLYAEGVGILTALSQGLEGKFKSRIQAALRIDKNFEQGGPQVVWGRFFYKLPWPKRDLDLSAKVLTEAVREHPKNLRAKYYLAETLLENGNKAGARRLIDEVMAAPIGADVPEDRKVKSETAAFIKEHQGDLK